MTMLSPSSTTVCLSFDSRLPASRASARTRWTAASTAPSSSATACPSCVVHSRRSFIIASTLGKSMSAWTLGSHCDACGGFPPFPTARAASTTWTGYADAGKDVGHQRVRIEGDRRDQRVEVAGRFLGSGAWDPSRHGDDRATDDERENDTV